MTEIEVNEQTEPTSQESVLRQEPGEGVPGTILLGPMGVRVAWLWGFAEAMFFFVVPDVWFTRTTVFSVRRGCGQLVAAIIGATMAGAVMFWWAAGAPQQARAAVASVPFVGEKIIAPAEAHWNARGTLSLFANPLGGVPYKVPAILAPAHVSMPTFLALSLPLRAERMLLSMIVFVPLAMWVARGGNRRDWRQTLVLRFHVAFWCVVYAIYWSINYS